MTACPWWLLAVLIAASATLIAAIARDMRRLPALVLIAETEQHLHNAAQIHNEEQQ